MINNSTVQIFDNDSKISAAKLLTFLKIIVFLQH